MAYREGETDAASGRRRPGMTYAKRRKATCNRCGRTIAVSKGGALFPHADPGRPGWNTCGNRYEISGVSDA